MHCYGDLAILCAHVQPFLRDILYKPYEPYKPYEASLSANGLPKTAGSIRRKAGGSFVFVFVDRCPASGSISAIVHDFQDDIAREGVCRRPFIRLLSAFEEGNGRAERFVRDCGGGTRFEVQAREDRLGVATGARKEFQGEGSELRWSHRHRYRPPIPFEMRGDRPSPFPRIYTSQASASITIGYRPPLNDRRRYGHETRR